MSSSKSRSLTLPFLSTARAVITMPLPLDIDLAPQLLVIAVAQTVLAATHRALDSAHPILAVDNPTLTNTEQIAVRILHASSQLGELLAEYNASVVHDRIAQDEDFPF